MAKGMPSLATPGARWGAEAMVALPGLGEFNPEPEYGPVQAVFLSVSPTAVPSQLDIDTFEAVDWVLSFRRPDVPGLRKGAVVRAAPPDTGVLARWFVVQTFKGAGHDEIRALVQAMPEEA